MIGGLPGDIVNVHMDPNRRTRILAVGGIVLVAAALVVTGIVAFSNIGRNMGDVLGALGRNFGDAMAGFTGDPETRSFELSDFDSVEIAGGWRVILRYDQTHSVSVTAPEDAFDELEVRRRGSALAVGFDRAVNWGLLSGDAVIEVGMPRLNEVVLQGGIDLRLEDFESESLRIRAEGGINIVADNCRVEDLELEIDGGASIDFLGSRVVDADLDLEGAADVRIHMLGGNLGGRVAGLASVKYRGEARVSVDTEGLSNVERLLDDESTDRGE